MSKVKKRETEKESQENFEIGELQAGGLSCWRPFVIRCRGKKIILHGFTGFRLISYFLQYSTCLGFCLSVTWSKQVGSDFKGNEESHPLPVDCRLTGGSQGCCQQNTHLWVVSLSNPTLTRPPHQKKKQQQASYGVTYGFLAPVDTGDTGENNICCWVLPSAYNGADCISLEDPNLIHGSQAPSFKYSFPKQFLSPWVMQSPWRTPGCCRGASNSICPHRTEPGGLCALGVEGSLDPIKGHSCRSDVGVLSPPSPASFSLSSTFQSQGLSFRDDPNIVRGYYLFNCI